MEFHFERMPTLDASFIYGETSNIHMHIAATMIHDEKPLRTEDGYFDIGRVRKFVESVLDQIPRYRQRVELSPVTKHPVFVDYPEFQIEDHIDLYALPRPGTLEQLKEFAGRLCSKPLDRSKPLWNIAIVEGLEGDRCAMIHRAHHCILDGEEGMNVLAVLMKPNPTTEIAEVEPWKPRPMPLARDLWMKGFARRLSWPKMAFETVKKAAENRDASMDYVVRVADGIKDSWLGDGLVKASPTPINQDIGPHRCMEWFDVPLDDVNEIRKVLGGTVNDLAVAVVAGGMRHYFEKHDANPDQFDCRALVPVSVRSDGQQGAMGNRVAPSFTRLPVHEQDPAKRLAIIMEDTKSVKASNQYLATDLVLAVADWTLPSMFAAVTDVVTSRLPYNVLISNLRGPPMPFYFLDSELLEGYPMGPLQKNQGVGVALFSYNGDLCFGLMGDRDQVPDIAELRAEFEAEIENLRAAAGLAPSSTA